MISLSCRELVLTTGIQLGECATQWPSHSRLLCRHKLLAPVALRRRYTMDLRSEDTPRTNDTNLKRLRGDEHSPDVALAVPKRLKMDSEPASEGETSGGTAHGESNQPTSAEGDKPPSSRGGEKSGRPRKSKEKEGKVRDRRRGTRGEETESRDSAEPKAPRLPKRQCALLIGFCGAGYNGMQMYVKDRILVFNMPPWRDCSMLMTRKSTRPKVTDNRGRLV